MHQFCALVVQDDSSESSKSVLSDFLSEGCRWRPGLVVWGFEPLAFVESGACFFVFFLKAARYGILLSRKKRKTLGRWLVFEKNDG